MNYHFFGPDLFQEFWSSYITVRNPPGKVWPTVGSESCTVLGAVTQVDHFSSSVGPKVDHFFPGVGGSVFSQRVDHFFLDIRIICYFTLS